MTAAVTSSTWTGWPTRGASAPLMKWSPTSRSTTEPPCWRVRQPDKPLPHSPPDIFFFSPSLRPASHPPPCGADHYANGAGLTLVILNIVFGSTLLTVASPMFTNGEHLCIFRKFQKVRIIMFIDFLPQDHQL